MRPKFIDSDEEYIRVLAELGQLDDMDDWKLYCEQEKRFDDIDIDLEIWFKYYKPSS